MTLLLLLLLDGAMAEIEDIITGCTTTTTNYYVPGADAKGPG